MQRLDFGGDSQFRHLYRQLCLPELQRFDLGEHRKLRHRNWRRGILGLHWLDFDGDSQLRHLYRPLRLLWLQRLDFGEHQQLRHRNRLRCLLGLQRLDFGGDSQLSHQNRLRGIRLLYLEMPKLL